MSDHANKPSRRTRKNTKAGIHRAHTSGPRGKLAPKLPHGAKDNAPSREANQFAPVFVLAPPRSYTSVVATMIGQHPELAGLPELKLFAYRTIAELEASLPSYWIARGFTHRSPGLVRALAQHEFGDQTAKNLVRAREWLAARAHWSGAQVFDVLLARLAPRAAVEKSPENVATDAALRRLAAAYPRARYLHLTRHPAATQASMVAHGRRNVPEHPMNGQPMAGFAAWRDVHARILRFAATLPAGRVMRVRAEDVLNNPGPQLRAIARWLGLRADERAIEAMCHPETSPFARPGPAGSGVIGGHDPGFLNDPVPRPVDLSPTLEQPPGWHGRARLWRATVALARRLGYGDAEPLKPGRHDGSARHDAGLRAELLRRGDADQAARSAFAGGAAGAARIIAMDEDNAAWLATIVERVGWPGYSLVGEDGAHAAWLLAQHADRNPDFQRRCLEFLTQAVARGDASPAHLAHLTDRVLLSSGKEQIYGTQITACAGRYVPGRLRDAASVDSRRAAVGLDPIETHLARAVDRYGPPMPARAPCPRCQHMIEVWPPEPGRTTRFKCPVCGATGTAKIGSCAQDRRFIARAARSETRRSRAPVAAPPQQTRPRRPPKAPAPG